MVTNRYPPRNPERALGPTPRSGEAGSCSATISGERNAAAARAGTTNSDWRQEAGEPQTTCRCERGDELAHKPNRATQDDVVSSIALERKSLADFIRKLARARAYQCLCELAAYRCPKLTGDLERAAKALSHLSGSPVSRLTIVRRSYRSPERFDSQRRRRGILLVSDGLIFRAALSRVHLRKSLDLQRAINEAQTPCVASILFLRRRLFPPRIELDSECRVRCSVCQRNRRPAFFQA